MAEYHVGAGIAGIYAGTLNKNKTMWLNKTECTDEAICAVRDYMFDHLLDEKTTKTGYEWTRKDGRIVKLLIEVEEKNDELI